MAKTKKPHAASALPFDADIALDLALATIAKRSDPTPEEAVDIYAKVWAALQAHAG